MDRVELNYTIKGEGEYLILLHGNGEDLSYFNHQVEFFSQFYAVVALDSRGHGKSPRGEGDFTLKRMSDDLYHFMIAKGIDKAHFLGFSDGANIALLFALNHVKMVSSLILNGGNLFPMGLKPDVLNEIKSDYYRVKENPLRVREKELLKLMLYEPNISFDDLKRVDVPVLIIVGTSDMIRRKHSRLMAKAFPLGHFLELEGTHFLASLNPDVFDDAVFTFLEDNANKR